MKKIKQKPKPNPKPVKVYISGKITGLPFHEVQQRFLNYEMLLEDLGMEPVNPLRNGLPYDAKWEEHLVKDIEMLLGCDAILMLNGWQNSAGACIEHDISVRTKKKMLFESTDMETIRAIQTAIRKVTGLRFSDYSTNDRKQDLFFARMIFCKKCEERDINPMEHLPRHRTMIYHYTRRYDDEMRFTPKFREMAMMVDEILNNKNKIL